MIFPATTRSVAKALLPVPMYERIRAVRSRRHQVQLLDRLGIADCTQRYVERNGTIVRYGPFQGVIYPVEAALNRHSIPKLLGTYEIELSHIINLAIQRRYECIIDIGTAEGYYAVGMAVRTKLPVYAYEPEPEEKRLCALMARINGVQDILHLNDCFTSADITAFADKRALVICDCEGFEAQLFNSDTVSLTSRWDLLIELHGKTREALPSLAWPHSTSIISAQPRLTDNAMYKEICDIGCAETLTCEFRGEEQRWLWCDGSKTDAPAPIYHDK